jgi:hypothetical protein
VFGNSKSDFDVIAILLATPEKSLDWESSRQQVRKEILGAKRRVSFKSLGDRVRQKSFVPFLEATDNVDGIITSIAIDKKISRNFMFGPDEIEASQNRKWLREKWKVLQLERMVTVAHFVAFLISGLSIPGQAIWWISDQDDMFANERFAQDTGTVFTKFLNLYSHHQYGTISVGTAAITEPDLLEEDLAAIADVAAGGSAELLTKIRAKWGRLPGIAVDISELPTRAQIFFTGSPVRAPG